ncbi:MAG: IS1096 element passenger TnpR family protein [Bacteroidota bacterium]
MVYRFKITFEDNEEVYREIEIKSPQTFEDFHHAIVQSIGFDNQHNASFFISDDYWRKGEEITLRNEEENDNKRKAPELKRLMNKCKMASLIDDPHQKFVYVYDPKTAWTFLIELMKIVPDDAKASYPKCAKSIGDSPKQYKTVNGLPPVVDDEDFDDEPHSDDEAYTNAHSDDETALLEGEEGEGEEEGEELADAEGDDFDPSEFEGQEGNDED